MARPGFEPRLEDIDRVPLLLTLVSVAERRSGNVQAGTGKLRAFLVQTRPQHGELV
jgi:hypothetical protein